jgi:thioredoxin-like negative regulator of GroEL
LLLNLRILFLLLFFSCLLGNVEENKEFSSSLGIRAIPTVKSFSGGKEVHSQSGVQVESQIKQLANNLING